MYIIPGENDWDAYDELGSNMKNTPSKWKFNSNLDTYDRSGMTGTSIMETSNIHGNNYRGSFYIFNKAIFPGGSIECTYTMVDDDGFGLGLINLDNKEKSIRSIFNPQDNYCRLDYDTDNNRNEDFLDKYVNVSNSQGGEFGSIDPDGFLHLKYDRDTRKSVPGYPRDYGSSCRIKLELTTNKTIKGYIATIDGEFSKVLEYHGVEIENLGNNIGFGIFSFGNRFSIYSNIKINIGTIDLPIFNNELIYDNVKDYIDDVKENTEAMRIARCHLDYIY